MTKTTEPQTAMEKAQQAVKRNRGQTGTKAAIASFNAVLERPEMQRQITDACSRYVRPERMMALVRTIVSRNPRIAQCSPLSVIGAMLDCSQLGLEPIPQLDHVYLVPYWNKHTGTHELQVQLGYKGMIALILRTGRYAYIGAETVHENDSFEMELGSNQHIRHTFDLAEDRGPIIGGWAKVVNANGLTHVRPITKADIEKARSLSLEWSQWDSKGRPSSGKQPVWEEHFDSMVRKTAVRRLFPFINLPIETQAVLQTDESIDHGRGGEYRDAIGWRNRGQPLFDMPSVPEIEENSQSPAQLAEEGVITSARD